MKTRSRTFWIPVIMGICLLSQMALADPPTTGSEPQFIKKTLDNGLEVIVIPDRTVPLVTVDIAVRNGAFTEPDEFAGLSHLYEHMFFKANQKYPSQEAYMKRIRELGISFNGYTSDEVVNYFFTLPKGELENGVVFMANAITTPLFVTEELQKERQVVLGEFDRNEAQPQFIFRYAMDSAIWNPYVSRKQPLGQRHVINTATVEKMEMIRNRFYVPNNSAMIISGDVDPDEVLKLAEKYLGDWKKGAEPFPTYDPPAFPALKPTLVQRPANIPNVSLRMAWHGPSVTVNEPDPLVADIATTMINQNTSRFYNRLVDSGLVTSVGFGYQTAHYTGEIGLYSSTTPENVKSAISTIKSELKAMTQPGYFTEEDLEIAKQIITDNRIFERENVYDYTIGTVAFWWSVGGGLDYYENMLPKMKTVTLEQVRSFLKKYVVNQPMVVGVAAQQETLDNLKLSKEVATW